MSSRIPFEPFKYKSLNDLKKKFEQLNLEIPISENIDILRQNVKLKDFYIPNRLAIQPMEGFDSKLDGSPGELTYRRYRRYANGGAGLIWFEATAISDGCRSNPKQLFLNDENLKNFKEFVSEIRKTSDNALKSLGFKDKCIFILQLNHSGRYTKKNDKKCPIRAYQNLELDKAIGASQEDGVIITDQELEELEDLWVNKAILAREVGFDGIDIKACHGYLINELLCSRLREGSKYGGPSFENRCRFILNILKKLSKQVKDDSKFILTSRLGIYDGIPYPNGFGVEIIANEKFPAPVDLSEPIELIEKMHNIGVRLINISLGNPRYSPHLTRPYDTPIFGRSLPSEHPLVSVNRLINLTSIIKKRLPEDMIVVGSGYSYLRQFAGYVGAGLVQKNLVDICGFGRMSFSNPNFPKQLFQSGVINNKDVCITCSKCSEFMRHGKSTGCAIRDPEYKNQK
jgi:2,4-dienoyl-CoA reductase-like NADH-dependent reductase (Old Yellow Enzyme family)